MMSFGENKYINEARMGAGHSHLSRMARERPRGKVIFDQRPKGSERAGYVTLRGKSIPDRDSMYDGPEVGARLNVQEPEDQCG